MIPIFVLFAFVLPIINAANGGGKCSGIIDNTYAVSCVLDENGISHCVGSEETKGLVDTPQDVEFSQIATQRSHACGIVAEDQSIVCWGTADTSYTNSLQPSPGKYIDVCAYLNTSCAVKEDGYLYCWGSNKSSKIVSLMPTDGDYKTIGCGYRNACAVKNDGSVVCWGYNAGNSYEKVQTEIPEGLQLEHISISARHAVGIKPDGTLVTWGDDEYDTFKDLPEGEFDSIAAESGGVAIKSDDKSLACWGRDTFGHVTDCPTGEFYAIGCYPDNCCAVRTNKEIVCWGNTKSHGAEIMESGIKPMDCDGGAVCGNEKAMIEELTAEIELWKLRFEKIENLEKLEYDNRHSVQAKAEYPESENDVGNSSTSDSFSNLLTFTLYIGLIFGIFGIGKYLGTNYKSNQTAVYTEMVQQ